jgi:hypothetical protein
LLTAQFWPPSSFRLRARLMATSVFQIKSTATVLQTLLAKADRTNIAQLKQYA